MDYQIILLPERDYWSWVRACSDYVMAYGANLTSDRHTAGQYMEPMQVITLPTSDRLKAERGDLAQWFDKNHPGVRVDAVQADKPSDLEEVLRTRLEAEDRYGQRQKPFYLLWPTLYPIITQKFGANPQIYTRFGMPGHEGLDIRALPNTDVTCCADGTVYRVHTNPDSHAYGIHVRVRHAHGYRTVYGHLARALVSEGQQLSAGQVLGKADSTGASTAAHLHLTLKQDGATARKETKYPKDVIDPTPFMVWPESSIKGLEGRPQWPAQRCLVGVHGRVKEPLREQEVAWLQAIEPEAVKLSAAERSSTIEKLLENKPDLLLVTRLEADFSKGPVAANQFAQMNLKVVQEHYQAGVRYFEIGSSPNMQAEGWNRSWRNGGEFAAWFEAVQAELRPNFNSIKLGFPGLSPGGNLSGWRQDEWTFLDEAEAAVDSADWLGVICHWMDEAEMLSVTGGRRYFHYRERFPDKLLMISEFNNPSSEVTRQKKAAQYKQYFRMIRSEDNVAAAFVFPLAASEGYEQVALLGQDDQTAGEISRALRQRDF